MVLGGRFPYCIVIIDFNRAMQICLIVGDEMLEAESWSIGSIYKMDFGGIGCELDLPPSK